MFRKSSEVLLVFRKCWEAFFSLSLLSLFGFLLFSFLCSLFLWLFGDL
jgi:hypothetical protein